MFSDSLEYACISLVQDDNIMTKDLALAVHGEKLTREHYVDTKMFLDLLEKKLIHLLGGESKI